MPSVDRPPLRLSPGLPAAEASGPRSALIITTERYRDPQLRGLRVPVHGADRLADVLGDPVAAGFAVTVLADRTDSEIRLGIARFLAGRSAAETVVVYLSCHAVRDRARLYFAAANTVMRYPAASAVPAGYVTGELDRCGAGRRVMILDCCTIGGFASEPPDVDIASDLALGGRSIAVLVGSRTREYSYEGRPIGRELVRSLFTTGLAEGLATGAADADGDGLITLAEAYGYASGYLRQNAPGQSPAYYPAGASPDIVLARTAGATVPPPQPAPPAPPALAALAALAASSARPAPTPRPSRRARQSGVVRIPSRTPPARTSAGPVIVERDRDDAYCVAFSPDGRLLASGGWGRQVRLRDMADGGQARELRAAGVAAYDLAFSPDGALLASAGADGSVLLHDALSGERRSALRSGDGIVNAIALTPDGAVLAAAGETGAVTVWHLDSGKNEPLPGHAGFVNDVTFSPDGRMLASAGKDGTVRIWR